jgi:hypothetical protein
LERVVRVQNSATQERVLGDCQPELSKWRENESLDGATR